MELTPDHLRAAQTCGCVFLPATDAQVQRLSMQRRIFRIGGRPFVATRDGGAFLETHATLLPLIGGQTPGRERGSEETAQEAAAADAEAAAEEIATEQGAARGGAQVVRRAVPRRGRGAPVTWRQAGRLTPPRRVPASAAVRQPDRRHLAAASARLRLNRGAG